MGTNTTINSFIKWSNSELELDKKFHLTKHSIHKALCGKFLSFNYFLIIDKSKCISLKSCTYCRQYRYKDCSRFNTGTCGKL